MGLNHQTERRIAMSRGLDQTSRLLRLKAVGDGVLFVLPDALPEHLEERFTHPQFASRETGCHHDVDRVYAELLRLCFGKTTGNGDLQECYGIFPMLLEIMWYM
jgi:hypothetical protein